MKQKKWKFGRFTTTYFFLSFLYKQNSFFEKNVSGYDYLRTLSMQIFKTLGPIRVCDVLFPWQRWLKTKKSEIIKVIES